MLGSDLSAPEIASSLKYDFPQQDRQLLREVILGCAQVQIGREELCRDILHLLLDIDGRTQEQRTEMALEALRTISRSGKGPTKMTRVLANAVCRYGKPSKGQVMEILGTGPAGPLWVAAFERRGLKQASKAGMLSEELPEGVQTVIKRYVGDDPTEIAAMPERHRQRGDFSSTFTTRMRNFSPPRL